MSRSGWLPREFGEDAASGIQANRGKSVGNTYVRKNITVTFPCEVEWKWPEAPGEEGPLKELVRNAGELRQLLANIRVGAEERQIAISVVMVTPKTNIFSLALGLGKGSILTYDGLGGEPPYLVSLGDPKKDSAMVSYFYMGQRI